jgi:hypothetical protein
MMNETQSHVAETPMKALFGMLEAGFPTSPAQDQISALAFEKMKPFKPQLMFGYRNRVKNPYQAVKPYWTLIMQQQKSYADLTLSWFDCIKSMAKIYREGQHNGEDLMHILNNFETPSGNLINACTSFLKGQSMTVEQICGRFYTLQDSPDSHTSNPELAS